MRLSNSARHCGRCGNSCELRPNAYNPCVAGTCVTRCRPGFLDCNGDAADGCETNVVAVPDAERRCPSSGDAGVDAAADAR